MKEPHRNAKTQIEFHLLQIEKELRDTAEFFATVQQRRPNATELRAVASTLHAFYNGVESAFSAVARTLDHKMPAGSGGRVTVHDARDSQRIWAGAAGRKWEEEGTSNAPLDISGETLLRVGFARPHIEQILEVEKGQVGFDEFEVRRY